MKRTDSARLARRLALLAATVAVVSGVYVAVAYAGPQGCDPAIVVNCGGDPPPAQGPPTRWKPDRLPVDQPAVDPGPVGCPPEWGCAPPTSSPPPTSPPPNPR